MFPLTRKSGRLNGNDGCDPFARDAEIILAETTGMQGATGSQRQRDNAYRRHSYNFLMVHRRYESIRLVACQVRGAVVLACELWDCHQGSPRAFALIKSSRVSARVRRGKKNEISAFFTQPEHGSAHRFS